MSGGLDAYSGHLTPVCIISKNDTINMFIIIVFLLFTNIIKGGFHPIGNLHMVLPKHEIA